MKLKHSGYLVDAGMLVSAVFLILAAGRLISLIVPSEFYFTFQSLFSDRPSQNLILATLGKMVAPLLSGFACGWFVCRRVFRLHGHRGLGASFRRRLKGLWSPTIFLGGFFAAFISAWPIMIYWNLMANPEVGHLKAVFFLLYLLYMLAYGYMALLGFLGAIFFREHLGGHAGAEKLVSLPELTRVGAMWLFSSGIASSLMEALTK